MISLLLKQSNSSTTTRTSGFWAPEMDTMEWVGLLGKLKKLCKFTSLRVSHFFSFLFIVGIVPFAIGRESTHMLLLPLSQEAGS